MKRTALYLIIFIALLFAATGAVRADVGNITPTLTFFFELPEGLTVSDGTLFVCSTASCADAEPYVNEGAQFFYCYPASCKASGGNFNRYQKLAVSLSDGSSVESNVFTHPKTNTAYTVTLQADGSLLVTLRAEASSSAGDTLPASRVNRYLLPLFYTLLIELALALGYVFFVNKEVSKGALLLGVLLGNVLTNPLFTWFSTTFGSATTNLFGEAAVILVEASLLFFITQKKLSLKQAFILSLVFNLVSAGLGLFLPF